MESEPEQPRNGKEQELLSEISHQQSLKTKSLVRKGSVPDGIPGMKSELVLDLNSKTGTNQQDSTMDNNNGWSVETKIINVAEESDASIFSVRTGHGSKANYDATGFFEGTRRANGCEFAIKKNEHKNKMDCYTVSFSYLKNGIPQHYTYSDSFLRDGPINLKILEEIQGKCWENNIRVKCTYGNITEIGSIGIVFYYRKLIVSVGKISDREFIPFSSCYEILGDLLGVIYVAIQKLEPSWVLAGWKNPDTLEEQMKKVITLEDDTLTDGVVDMGEKTSILGWLWNKKPKMGSQPLVPDPIIY